jgi:glycosyltransferase involved in cell wall biosynthesis
MLPRVSAIIPSHNSSAWIRECVGSVLRQSYSNLEIIVVDDGSQDSTLAVLSEFGNKIKIIERQHTGIGAARNAGIEIAQGEFIAFLDSDDIWHEEKIHKQVDFMLRNPEVVLLYTDAEEFSESGTDSRSFFDKFPALALPEEAAESMVLRWAVPLTSTIMMRGDFLRQHGLRFHPTASCAEDLSLFFEIHLHGGRFAKLEDRLVRRRLHNSNSSGNHYNRFFQRLTVYGDLLRRYPNAARRSRRVLLAGLHDANFRVGEWHWGELDMRTARGYFRNGAGLDRSGIRCCFSWALTFAPKPAILTLKLKQAKLQPVSSEVTSSAVPNSVRGEGRARD